MKEGDDEDGGIVKKVVEGEIDGVLTFDEYFSCMSCKAKVANVNGGVGECSRCGMLMKVGKCKKQGTVKVMVGRKDKNYVLTLFHDMMSKVDGDCMEMKLLSAPAHILMWIAVMLSILYVGCDRGY